MLPPVFGVLFDGIAYGMLLFILAVGLAVTMGLMNFINLAHGAFAMVGGYITVVLMQRYDVHPQPPRARPPRHREFCPGPPRRRTERG